MNAFQLRQQDNAFLFVGVRASDNRSDRFALAGIVRQMRNLSRNVEEISGLDDRRDNVEESFAYVPGECEVGVEMVLQIVVEYAADAARDAAVRKPEIFVGPLGEAWIECRVVSRAGSPEARPRPTNPYTRTPEPNPRSSV